MKNLNLVLYFIPCLLWGQAELIPLAGESIFADTQRSSLQHHTTILPAIAPTPADQQVDTVPKKTYQMRFAPLTQMAYRSYLNQYRTLLGVQWEQQIGKKLYSTFSYQQGFENATDRFEYNTLYTRFKDINFYDKLDLRGRISYSPHRYVNLQIGHDENFIGEGRRSLLLSDYGKPYGFGLARFNFWRVDYLVLYQWMREPVFNQTLNKYATSHYLNFSAAEWLHFGLFETVVFAPKDTLLNRGYEPEYLNPMLFFRPQEYALGSSDNVLIGADLRISLQSFVLYGQVILDEFDLVQIRAKNKYWANKFGVQAGIKHRGTFHKMPVESRVEFNAVRPFTYAHLSLAQSYTNRNDVLAHPYGAGFSEILGEVTLQKDQWKARLFVSYSLRGLDSNQINYGGNIFIPYINRADDFGHTIGQGQANNQFMLLLNVARKIPKIALLEAFLEYQGRYNTFLPLPAHQVIIGLRSKIWNDYRDY